MAKLSPRTRQRIQHGQRKVYIVIAKLRDCPDRIFMDLCTQCLHKRTKEASKLPWNRSVYNGQRGRNWPDEYYQVYHGVYGWTYEDTTNLKCQDCGWTAKGR